MYADLTLMDLAAAYAKRRNGRKTKHAVACDRPGAKAEMAITKEQIRAASSEELRAIDRRLMELAKSGDKNAAALLDYVREEYNDRYRGTHSRPGAKAKMALGTYKEGDRTVAVDGRKYEVLPYQVDFFLADLGKQDDAAWRASVVKHYLRKGYIKATASRPGAKAKFAESVTYSVAAHIGHEPAGERTTKSLEEAKAYAKAMLQTAKANAKGKPVVVDVYPVVNYEPKPAVLTLRASRPGAKSTHAAAHPSWSEGVLGDKANPALVAYAWIDRNIGSLAGRTHMLLADLAATAHRNNPSASVQQAVLAAAKDMVRKGVAPADIKTFVENGGRFSRPGAKAKSTHAVATPAMRDIEKKMRELMREADALTAQSLSATISSEKRNQLQDKIERISDMLDVLGEDLLQQRKAAGFAKSTHAALPPQTLEAERKPGGGSHSEAVSRKIATLINEGKPQDQAVAIALDLERRGEL